MGRLTAAKAAFGRREEVDFVHLHVHSPFSFLDGASSIDALISKAAELGMPAIALTDHDNVCAAVDFHRRAATLGIKPIQGAEVTLEGGTHLTLLARDRSGYAALCRALTAAHLEAERLHPALKPAHLSAGKASGLIALTGCRRGEIPRALLDGDYDRALTAGRRLREIFGPDSLFIELEGTMLPGTRALNESLVDLAGKLGVGYVATNNVHYRDPADFSTHDLLTCVRTLTRLDEVHPERRFSAEHYLKSGREMVRSLWGLSGKVVERALRTTAQIAASCSPVLQLGKVRHPGFAVPAGQSAAEMLRRLTFEGARKRYPRITRQIRNRLEHELDTICSLGYEQYFLLVWDVVAHARRCGIRCAGRGSAADSAVAYCLFITDVDSIRRGLLFERFMSPERAEMPDIDIDFDARRRDEVTRYVYRRYGRDHVATVATYNTFHARSAVRDLGKAMGFAPSEIDAIAKRLPWGMHAGRFESAFEQLPELRDSGLAAGKYARLAAACSVVAGFPRHLSTHLGGVVISGEPLTNLTPLQTAAKGVVVTQFDKRGVEDLGLVKLDLLCLRTLGAVDDTLRSLNRGGEEGDGVSYERIPHGDEETYRMINRGETVGVFQLESPAQRALQSRLGAGSFEDIVASVALIRPGPIKGNMVEPFIARRKGQEEITYLHPALRPILEKTYGVVLFQEQVIEIATAVAGFGPGEADRLRRVMTHGRSREEMTDIGRFFVSRAVERGVEPDVAETIFSYVAGYASYGFCEAHAAAFGDIAYRTAYLLRHYPAHYLAALLSGQPMGYYPPHVLCVEARRRGIDVLAPDVNRSEERFSVEDGRGSAAIRTGLRQVKGLGERGLAAILEARGRGSLSDLADFLFRTVPGGLDLRGVESLILSGACDSLGPTGNRKALIWAAGPLVEAARAGDTPLSRGLPSGGAARAPEDGKAHRAGGVPDYSPWEKLLHQYDVLGFTTGPHPMAFYRRALSGLGYLDSSRLVHSARRGRPGRRSRVRIAGIPVRPHRPPTRSGRTVVFLSLEDEFGLADVTVFEQVYDRCGRLIFQDPTPPLAVCGRLERRGKGVSVVADEVRALSDVVERGPAGGGAAGCGNEGPFRI